MEEKLNSKDTISLSSALELVYELAESKFPKIPQDILKDFADLLVCMAGDRKVLFLREVYNAFENLGMALKEGDYSMLSQPRGLRTARIVEVDEFVESRFFMGQKGYVRPKVLEKLYELFHGENAENNLEVVLGGGIGWGKSYFSEMALGYMLYKLSCFYNPQAEYGLAPGSSIYFVMQSIKEDLAKKVLFGQFSQRLRRSEYFSKYFPFDTGIMSELRFPNNIMILPLSSSDTSALGLNVFGGILDELSFMARVQKPSSSRFTGEQEYDQAAKLYSTIVRRMKSRFNVRGRVPGKVFLISSANYPGDFIDRKIHEAEDEKLREGKSNIFVVRMSQWESRTKESLSSETFLVEVGNETRRSRLIDSIEDAIDPDSVLEIPVDYREDFQTDLEAAIRDLAGIPIGGISAFIKKRETIEQAAKLHEQLFDGQQLFMNSSIDLSRYSGRLNDLLNKEYLERLDFGTCKSFCASVDLALTGDSCGFAIGHYAGIKTVGKTTNWDEETKTYIEVPAGEAPLIIIDGLLEIVPPQVDEIDISLIGDLLEMLNSRLPMEIVTADSFQSAALLQRMRKLVSLNGRRLRSGMLSVDATIAPYSEVKQALRDQRLSFPNFDKVKRELRELILDPKAQKIDHPVEGSKHVADALAACTYIIAKRNSGKSLKSSPGRKLLAGIDSPDNEVTPRKRPAGRGHRVL